MAFIIISNKDTEIGRRTLSGGILVGRAPDCDLSVHDILLSRHHCRIEPSGRGWVILDLRSKNGTWLDGQRVGRRSLRDGEIVRAGNTTIRFMTGELIDDPSEPRLPKGKPRPADPFEAMAGTVMDFDPGLVEESPEAIRARANSRMPYPRPMPREPISYAQDGVYSLLEEIASSSWDSIYANVSRPIRPPPSPGGVPGGVHPAQESSVATLEPPVETVSAPRPVKRPTIPTRPPRPLNAHKMAGATLVTPVRSRLHVDFSLQAPAIRVPRTIHRSLPELLPARPVPESPHEERKSLVERLLRWVPRALAAARSRIAPRGFVMLF